MSDKQKANHLDNSIVNQVKGDMIINQGLTASDVIAIVKATVSSEIAICSNNAEIEAEKRLQKFSDDLVEEIVKKVSDKLYRFNEPALQFAVREAALGYVKSGSEFDEANLIDLMIERIKVHECSTKQKLIDQAIKIVPTLSNSCLTLLSLLGFKNLYYTGYKVDFDRWFKSINHIIDSLSDITLLDVGYLQQTGCISGVVGVTSAKDYIDFLLGNCDFAFRHPVPKSISEKFKNKYGLKYDSNGHLCSYNKQIGPFESFITKFLGLGNDVKEIVVDWSNKKGLIELLYKYKLDYLVDDIQEMYDSSVPYSRDEVKSYLISINPRWSYVLDLFNRKDIKSYTLTAVGYYIASRILTNEDNDISLELFYSSL